MDEALLSGLADILWAAALGGHAPAASAGAPPVPGAGACAVACTVALLPPDCLPFEGTAAELQAGSLRELVPSRTPTRPYPSPPAAP